MTCHEREAIPNVLVEDRKVVGRNDDVARGRSILRVSVGVDLVGKRSLQRLDRDGVARHEFINAIERRFVGRAMTGDSGIARLAG